IRLALQECGRRLGAFLRRHERAKSEFRRRNIFELYIEEVVEACARLEGGKFPKEKLNGKLQKIALKRTGWGKAHENSARGRWDASARRKSSRPSCRRSRSSAPAGPRPTRSSARRAGPRVCLTRSSSPPRGRKERRRCCPAPNRLTSLPRTKPRRQKRRK